MCEYVFCRKIKLNLARKEKMVSRFVQNRRLMDFIFTSTIIRLKKVNQGSQNCTRDHFGLVKGTRYFVTS